MMLLHTCYRPHSNVLKKSVTHQSAFVFCPLLSISVSIFISTGHGSRCGVPMRKMLHDCYFNLFSDCWTHWPNVCSTWCWKKGKGIKSCDTFGIVGKNHNKILRRAKRMFGARFQWLVWSEDRPKYQAKGECKQMTSQRKAAERGE